MKAGNKDYTSSADLPETLPVFPLAGTILLPGGRLPLNLFEPRYLAMFDDALAGARLIGMVQPRYSEEPADPEIPPLCKIGTLGRITSFDEAGDGRYIIALEAICRFEIAEELTVDTPYRQCRVLPRLGDLTGQDDSVIDRPALLEALRAFLKTNAMDADWDSIHNADNEGLVNTLAMMSPYGPAEKQALLEAPDLKTRAETLVAITQMALARQGSEYSQTLQ